MGWIQRPSRAGLVPAYRATPVILTPSLPQTDVGIAYLFQMQAASGVPPYTWSISSGSLPAGLSLSPSGLITGTATTAGTASVSFVVTDSMSSPSAPSNFSLVVNPAVTVSTSSPLPGATTGSAYSQTLSASGGLPGYTWTLVSGSLPTGLSFNTSTGVISGTPGPAGTFSITVTATDTLGSTSPQKTLSLTVTSNLAISTSSPLPSATINVSYSDTLSASGGSSPYTWAILSGQDSNGFPAINASTGGLSGIPTLTESLTLSVKVTDAYGNTATKSFSLTVAGTSGLTINGIFPSGNVGSFYGVQLTGSGGSGNYAFALVSATPDWNDWITVSSAGTVNGTPQLDETETVTVQMTDVATSQSTQRSFTFTVNPQITFNFYISPTGDDGTGAGTLASPWSLNALNSKTSTISAVSNPVIGLVATAGSYRYSKTNGTNSTLYSMLQNAAISTTLFTIPSNVTLAACDSDGNYSTTAPIIDASDPSTQVTFQGYTTGSGTESSSNSCQLNVTSVTSGFLQIGQFVGGFNGAPTWIIAQNSGTVGGVGNYEIGPQGQVVGSSSAPVSMYAVNVPNNQVVLFGYLGTAVIPPTTGNITIDRLVIRNSPISALSFQYVNKLAIRNCEIGPIALAYEPSNPSGIYVSFADGLIVYNNLIHDCNVIPAVSVTLTAIPSGTITPGTTTWTLSPTQFPNGWPMQSGAKFNFTAVLPGTNQTITGVVPTFGSSTISFAGSAQTITSGVTSATVQISTNNNVSWYGGGYGFLQIPAGDVTPSIVQNNTIYRCGTNLQKDYPNNNGVFAYNYVEIGAGGQPVANGIRFVGCGQYQTTYIHHNVFWGPAFDWNQTGAALADSTNYIYSVYNTGTYNVYNNTFLSGSWNMKNNQPIQPQLTAAPSGTAYTGGTLNSSYQSQGWQNSPGTYPMLLSTGQVIQATFSTYKGTTFTCPATNITGSPSATTQVTLGAGKNNFYNNLFYYPPDSGMQPGEGRGTISADWFAANSFYLAAAPSGTFTGGSLVMGLSTVAAPWTQASGSYTLITSTGQAIAATMTNGSASFTTTSTTITGTPTTVVSIGNSASYWSFIGTWNYNGYQSTMPFCFYYAGYPLGSYPLLTLTEWQTANYSGAPPGFPGYDSLSVSLTSSPWTTAPVPIGDGGSFNMSQYTLNTGAALTASNTGGPLGAMDGSGTPGCNLTPSSI